MELVRFEFPSIKEVARINLICDRLRNNLTSIGVPTKPKLMFYLNKYGIYTYDMESEIDKLENMSKFKYKKAYLDIGQNLG